MKKHILFLLLAVALTALATWRVTVLTLHIEVSEDTAYVTSFGQTDQYYCDPAWEPEQN
jgi:hypothetical protein